MNIKQRMINMQKRRNPETKGMTDKEIESKFLKKAFVEGFRKAASPVLTDLSYDGHNDEYKAQRQSILERSYQNNDDDKKPGTKHQKDTKKVVKEDPALGLTSRRATL